MEQGSIDVIIPVYHPGKEFEQLLEDLQRQTVNPNRIIVLQTVEPGEKPMEEVQGIEIYPIKKEDFDHGKTRDYGAKMSQADYILMMTQDAVPADNYLLENLREGFNQENVGIVYARQLPREDADIVEVLTREFNYPDQSRLKTKEDLKELGIKTYFCSDVCAMYDRKRYEELGGFVYPTIFNEDMIMAWKMIQADYNVYYEARACVIHSHSYTCKQQFVRSFDLGVSQKEYHQVFESVSSEKEGGGFAKKTILTLCKKGHFGKAVYFAWQCAFRLAGYKKGLHYDRLSKKKIEKYTMNPGYWTNYKEK